jgi:hypothetical protein
MIAFGEDRQVKMEKTAKSGWILFALGMGLYLLTRFLALDKFPIYFFSDEAIQTMSAFDLIKRGFRDIQGNIFPVYFENGQQFNLSLSVWLQVLIAWLPRSVWLTRGLPALISLVFPLSVTLWAKDFFKSKIWWLAPYVISALPAWFLHSRTAFETSLGLSFYSLFLYFYLKYREQNPKHLPLALLFGACAFYSYAPMQLVVGVTGLVLLVVDCKYHFANRKSLITGGMVLLLLAFPYFRFRFSHQEALRAHLQLLRSYWLSDLSVIGKLGLFGEKWLKGLDPRYWFLPNQVDLIRHQMKGLGHLPWFFFPAFVLGLAKSLKEIKKTPYRLVVIAFLVGPFGAAMVDISITRVLVMNLPFALMIFLGFDCVLGWMGGKFAIRKAVLAGLAGSLFLFSLWMCVDAVQNGALWYPDYSLYGMQWGGCEINEKIESFLEENPDAELTLSPSWANNTDIIMRFFLGDPLPVTLGTTLEYDLYYREIRPEQVFIIAPEEFEALAQNPKFEEIQVLDTLPWPDGRTGFYFVKLKYSPDAEEIFAEELLERQQPVELDFDLMGQRVRVSHSRLDMGTVASVFDGNRATLIRSLEANPLMISIDFPEAVALEGATVLVGAPATQFTVAIVTEEGDALTFMEKVEVSDVVRAVSVDFGEQYSIKQLQIWVESLNEAVPAHVHLWELILGIEQ